MRSTIRNGLTLVSHDRYDVSTISIVYYKKKKKTRVVNTLIDSRNQVALTLPLQPFSSYASIVRTCEGIKEKGVVSTVLQKKRVGKRDFFLLGFSVFPFRALGR